MKESIDGLERHAANPAIHPSTQYVHELDCSVKAHNEDGDRHCNPVQETEFRKDVRERLGRIEHHLMRIAVNGSKA